MSRIAEYALQRMEKAAIDAGARFALARWASPTEIVVRVTVLPDKDGSELQSLMEVSDAVQACPRPILKHGQRVRVRVSTRKLDNPATERFAERMRRRRGQR